MELIQQELKFYTPSVGKISGFSESTDVIIPDSYPDFDETAFSCATINVKDELKQPGRILISGQIDAVVLYRCFGQEKLHRLNIPLNFAHVEDTKGIGEDALYFIQYAISQVDVRIVNSRKINVTCACIVKPQAFTKSIASITNHIESESESLQLRTQHRKLSMVTAAEVTRFVILDDLELVRHTEDSPLHTEVSFRNIDCSVSNGRVMLNGAVYLRIWELNAEAMTHCHTHEIPFHQILDTNVLCENTPTQVQLSCHSTICHYSNNDILSVNFNTEALFWQQTEQEIAWIDDLYDTKQDLHPVFQPISLTSQTDLGTFRSSTTETLMAAHDISEIISTELVVTSLLPSESIELKPILFCSILYLDDSKTLHQLQKQITTSLMPEQGGEIGSLLDLSCAGEAAAQDGQITLRVSVTGRSSKNTDVTMQNLTELSATPAENKNPHPLKILYLHDQTSLWKIAKENRSTIRLITQSNALPENTSDVSNSILLIP